MQKTRQIYVDRLDRFLSYTLFSDVNLWSALVNKRTALTNIQVYHADGLLKPPFNQVKTASFTPYLINEEFGPSWSTHWFQFDVLHFEAGMYLEWRAECEGLLYHEDGTMVSGVSEQRFYIKIPKSGRYFMGLGKNLIGPPPPDIMFKVEKADLIVFNEPSKKLMIAMNVLKGIATKLKDNYRGEQALFTANEIINKVDLGNMESVTGALRMAESFLSHKNAPSAPRIHALGHCHIDTAWLWDYAETRRKCARSWASQIELMDRFPDYSFACSQMQQMQWLLEDYPDLFNRIKLYVKKGQFIPVGGSWVEMDGNMPSGESMVRQFLYGQKFLKQHFGLHSPIFWLPDTFGYCGQLPQIMRHCGVEYFFSQKLSWNNINRFPHHSFHWVALDGRSSVLSHFTPHNGIDVGPHELVETINSNKEKDRNSYTHGLVIYGHGDGGGGPTEQMLLNLQAMKDCDGLARIENVHPNEFFKTLKQQVGDRLLKWNGELYFELHRGTYTTQAAIKHYNRRCESLLYAAEFLSVLTLLIKNVEYPQEMLEKQWKSVLLNQFHDVLPGSSINKVYKDAVELYEQVQVCIGKHVFTTMNSMVSSDDAIKHMTIFNPLSVARSECLRIDDRVMIVADIPPLAFKTVNTADLDNEKRCGDATAKFVSPFYVLENKFVCANFDTQGRLVSLYDKVAHREVIERGQYGNQLILYDDVPIFWDAWDVELYHLEKYTNVDTECNTQVEKTGPEFASLKRKVKISQASECVQIISLDCLSPRLTFECKIEWHERHKMLKVEFPVAIHSDTATYETQHGLISRPTHSNTSWEVAKFEVCGLRFMNISEPHYGCALISDSKYGYSCQHNRMRLSLLRSPKNPDPECDQGAHVFKYALYPHRDDLASVHSEATRFCAPLLWCPGHTSEPQWAGESLFSLPGMAIDCVKRAESSADIVLRAYEPFGARGTTALKPHRLLKIRSARMVNGLEEDLQMPLALSADGFVLQYLPFQLVTISLQLE